MSQNGDAGQETDADGRTICRDFLNKVCNRGTRCKFYHPPSQDGQQSSERAAEDFSFCIDYQEDVEHYKRTGDVTTLLARAIAAVTKADNIQGIPFCKEYQSARCMRGPRCRYWHVNVEAERERRAQQPAGASAHMEVGGGGMQPQPLLHDPAAAAAAAAAARRRHAAVDDYGDSAAAGTKRANYGPAAPVLPPPAHHHLPPHRHPAMPPLPPHMGPGLGGGPAAAHHYAAELERENADLKRELDSVRRELQREKDRYDALLAAISHQPPAGGLGVGAAAANAAAAVQQQQNAAQAQQQNPAAVSAAAIAAAYHDPYASMAQQPGNGAPRGGAGGYAVQQGDWYGR